MLSDTNVNTDDAPNDEEILSPSLTSFNDISLIRGVISELESLNLELKTFL